MHACGNDTCSVTMICVGGDKPSMRELCENIVTQYAAKWKELGSELGLEDYVIANIQENNARHPRRVEECCNAMLQQWLKMIPFPTWGKLDDAVIKLAKPSIDETIITDSGNNTPGTVDSYTYIVIDFACTLYIAI